MAHIDIIYIPHQFHGFLLANVFMQCSAEFIGNVVFTIRKCTGSAKTAHNGTGRTSYTVLDCIPIDRTFSLLKFSALLKNGNLQFRFLHGHFPG